MAEESAYGELEQRMKNIISTIRILNFQCLPAVCLAGPIIIYIWTPSISPRRRTPSCRDYVSESSTSRRPEIDAA